MAETHSAQRPGTASIVPAARAKTEAVTEAVPNSRAGRICANAPRCKRILALNNTSGLCGECRERRGRSHSKKANGHGLQLTRRQAEEPAPAKANGAHRDPADVNGNRERQTESQVEHGSRRIPRRLAASRDPKRR